MINVSPDPIKGANMYYLTDLGHSRFLFDLLNTGHPVKIAWLEPGSTLGVLVLPNKDGSVTDSKNLFGNYTPQPPVRKGDIRNGFNALAVYDRPEHGGNGDGWIDAKDNIYPELGIWIRLKSGEMKVINLLEAGVERIKVSNPMPESVTDGKGNWGRRANTAMVKCDNKEGACDREAMDWWLQMEGKGPVMATPKLTPWEKQEQKDAPSRDALEHLKELGVQPNR